MIDHHEAHSGKLYGEPGTGANQFVIDQGWPTPNHPKYIVCYECILDAPPPEMAKLEAHTPMDPHTWRPAITAHEGTWLCLSHARREQRRWKVKMSGQRVVPDGMEDGLPG